MGRVLFVVAVLAFVVTLGAVDATAGPKDYHHFFNWLRDADGDGIPNCMDEDWVCPQDGSGYQLRNGFGALSTSASPLNGAQNQQQYRHRKNRPDTSGDTLRDRLRKRDGSCTP